MEYRRVMRPPTDREWHRAQSSLRYALHWPFIWVSKELMDYVKHRWAWWYRVAHYDFDMNCYLYALLPLVPLVKVWVFWRRYRWIVERTLRHRIFYVDEGDHCKNWRLAPMREWSWKRNYYRMS